MYEKRNCGCNWCLPLNVISFNKYEIKLYICEISFIFFPNMSINIFYKWNSKEWNLGTKPNSIFNSTWNLYKKRRIYFYNFYLRVLKKRYNFIREFVVVKWTLKRLSFRENISLIYSSHNILLLNCKNMEIEINFFYMFVILKFWMLKKSAVNKFCKHFYWVTSVANKLFILLYFRFNYTQLRISTQWSRQSRRLEHSIDKIIWEVSIWN